MFWEDKFMVFDRPENDVPVKIDNDYEVEACPFCGSSKIVRRFGFEYMRPVVYSTCEIELKRNPSLYKCCDCDASFCSGIVSEKDSRHLYETHSSMKRWNETRCFEKGKSKEIIACLDRYLMRGKCIADIGCNTGELLDYAAARGCVPVGIEYSSDSRKALESKGYKAFSSIEDVDQGVDIITAFDLLEHLYNPGDFLEKCYALLNDGGVFIILTGNISSLSAKLAGKKWWYMRYPEHISFISRKFCRGNKFFKLQEWVNTFAMVEHEHTLGVKDAFSLLLQKKRDKYIGMPAIGRDHVLVVLEKRKSPLE